jgi:hypothetical protein
MFQTNRALGVLAVTGGFALCFGLVAPACSSSSGSSTQTTVPGTVWPGIGTISDGAGHTLKPLPIPNPTGANTIYVTASGEAAAVSGWPFPPQSTEGNWSNYTWAVDGWQFVIEKYIVNVANITLWSNPNESVSDQSLHGAAVAQITGPFVIDLHNMNVPNVITGQGGAPEQAVPIGVFTNQNLNGGASFSETTTYGFGFSTVPASYTSGPNGAPPYNVNLAQDEQADFDEMVANGYSVLYVGTATWNGAQSPYGCQQTNAGAGVSGPAADAGTEDGGAPAYVDGGYDFSQLPQTFTFRFGFSTPTNYVNCQNFTASGAGIGNEPNPRGVQTSPSQSTIAQVTVHMDHPFWESFVEDTPVHLDQIAAQYVGIDAGIPEAHTEDMKGVPPNAFTDHNGTPLPWHNCSGSNYQPLGNGQMFFYTKGIPIDPGGTCVQGNCNVIRDYYDFMRYTQSTQGHLNSQGLCYVDRQYPSPSGNSAAQ